MRNFMTTTIDHNKLLTKIAKSKFKSHDIKQKGQSRLFYFDNYWFTILIEFQPFSHDKGTFLNVAADFNFYPRDYFAYRLGGRETEFIPFENEEQFSKAIDELCDIAIKKVEQIKSQLADYSSAEKILINDPKLEDGWNKLDIAFVSALNGNLETATNSLNKILADNCTYEWEYKRKEFVSKIIGWLGQSDINAQVDSQIKQARKLKKLDK